MGVKEQRGGEERKGERGEEESEFKRRRRRRRGRVRGRERMMRKNEVGEKRKWEGYMSRERSMSSMISSSRCCYYTIQHSSRHISDTTTIPQRVASEL